MDKLNNRPTFRSALLGVASAMAIALTTPVALAQGSSAEEQMVALGAQPLGDTLIEISDIFGVTVMATESMVAGKMAPTLSGTYSAQSAIDALLQGSGLSASANETGDFIVSVTPEVTVSPPAESSVSPTPEEAPRVEETIIVTGQQIDRSLKDTKESVALITAEDIQNLELLDISDALIQTANVAATGAGVQNFAIRGIARPAFVNGGVGDLGIIFYDDVAITGAALNFTQQNLWDVEQLEFLRGPQSANVGRNALAGAIVIRSAEPNPDEFEAATRFEYGNYNTYALEGMANIPLTNNSALRLTAERSETEGFFENTTLNDDTVNGSDFTSLRAQYFIEPTSNFSAKASLQYTDGFRGDNNYVVEPGAPVDSFETRSNVAGGENFEGFLGSINLEYDVSEQWRIQSITAFLDGEYARLIDNDLTEFDFGTASNSSEQFNISQELKAFYNSDRLRGIIGVYYLHDENNGPGAFTGRLNAALAGIPSSLLPFYPEAFDFENITDSKVETDNYALFTQWDYSLDDQITLSAGFRYDFEETKRFTERSVVLGERTPFPDPEAAGIMAEQMSPGSGASVEASVSAVNAALAPIFIPSQETASAEYEAFLPEIGVTYAATENVNVSAFYKRGYRAGGSSIDLSGNINEFDPEYLDSFELSLRSEWLDRRLLLNANAYYGLWTDQQLNVPIDGNPQNLRTVNAGESTIYGFELETSYKPTPDTILFANLGYAQTEFEEFCRIGSLTTNLPECEIDGGAGRDLSGNEFGVSPDWTFSFGGTQYFAERFFIQSNVTYQADFFGDAENSADLQGDDFLLLNATAGYEGEAFRLSIYGRNLTDEFYNNFPFRAQGGQLGIIPGAPREFGIIVSKSF